MKSFIPENSIVRKIWRTTDVVLFVFAGSAAEFALNKQVDWLYFTGNLPADPIGRLFSTVRYAQQIIFHDERRTNSAIARINAIHQQLETSRGRNIPEAAYHDVLFMLVHYSIGAYELLERKLTDAEKDEVVVIFQQIGGRMNLKNLPITHSSWRSRYANHLAENLENGRLTKDLFRQYKKHLGWFRYSLMLEVQRHLVSREVNELLHLGRPGLSRWALPVYKTIRHAHVRKILIRAMVPRKFQTHVRSLELYESGKPSHDQASYNSSESV